MSLFRTKPIAELQAEATAEHGYKRTLGPVSFEQGTPRHEPS